MKSKILVLGAGFGGLELSTLLSEELGEAGDVTLIDQSDSFAFGFSKLDIMFGRCTPESVRLPYRNFLKPGVTFRQERITAIDPEIRRVVTDRGSYDADVLVVALGADYDIDATPGLAESGNEFYTFAGAEVLSKKLPLFTKGHAIVGVTAWPYKCPPAPSEAALMLHDYLSSRGVRESCEITMIIPMSAPVPPSPETSKAILRAFAERDIKFIPSTCVVRLDPGVAILDSGVEMPFDLFLGVPQHRAPDVVIESGMAGNGFIRVNPGTLETRFSGVYAIGDVAAIGIPKAGVFAEGAARVVAQAVIAEVRGGEMPGPFEGAATCYIEFGGGQVARVDVNFLSGPSVNANYTDASTDLVAEKQQFGASRRARWFAS
jgi:sulfide:quinone oxidoreductase